MAKRHTPQRHPRDDEDSRHSTTSISSDESDDEAMTAFFEGTTDSRNRRFGWRR